MIIMILRALVLSTDVKPENNFLSGFTLTFHLLKSLMLGVLVVYQVVNLPIEKLCMIKNF